MNSTQRDIRFGLRPKLFLLVFLGFSLLTGTIFLLIDREAEREANAAINRTLEQSRVVLVTAMEGRYDDIFETAMGIAGDGRVLPPVIDGDSASLQDLASEFERVLDFDILMVTDAEGRVLARSDLPAAVGASLRGRSRLIDEALAGQRSQGILYSSSELHQIVAVPIRDNVDRNIVRGTLALASRLSAELGERIARLTNAEVAFLALDRSASGDVTGVSHRYVTRADLGGALDAYLAENRQVWQGLADDAEASTLEMTLPLAGEQFHGVLKTLERSGGGALGYILTLRSRTELLQPFLVIQQRVLLAGIALLVVGSLGAWFIASGIASPIIRLTGVTAAIQDGRFPEAQDPKRNDEVGVLYRAVYQMSDALREKAELEDYLAGLSEDWSEAEHPIDLGDEESIAPLAAAKPEPTVQRVPMPAPALAEGESTGSGDPSDATTALRTPNRWPTVGQVFAERYRIQRVLGSGAMGVVYLADDTELQEPVALKLIKQETLSADSLELFKSEIRLARRITHRNVVRTYDFGAYEDVQYISMEYVPGFTLYQLLHRKGPLDVKMALLLARQICSAVGTAHSEGILHRDLKPQNMVINRQGVLKIMDFGLAQRVRKPAAVARGALDPTVRAGESGRSGLVVGTPNYMSLEQFLDDELDGRADIYAIGAIMFTMLTGEVPYPNLTPVQRVKVFENEPVLRLSQRRRGIDPAVDRVVAKAMAHRREVRYQSIRDLQADLMGISV